jgi:hypothetical protein
MEQVGLWVCVSKSVCVGSLNARISKNKRLQGLASSLHPLTICRVCRHCALSWDVITQDMAGAAPAAGARRTLFGAGDQPVAAHVASRTPSATYVGGGGGGAAVGTVSAGAPAAAALTASGADVAAAPPLAPTVATSKLRVSIQQFFKAAQTGSADIVARYLSQVRVGPGQALRALGSSGGDGGGVFACHRDACWLSSPSPPPGAPPPHRISVL